MSAAADAIDRIAPTRRPAGSPVGYQTWSDLLFVHWRLPPSLVASLVPDRLTIDTFDGAAWVGLVPFHMSGVRPRWSPPVPGVSAFHETNVRTYVHLDGRDPAVWFFSLEASSSLAVRIARWRWRLAYYRARMQLRRSGQQVEYASERLWPGKAGPSVVISAEVGDLIGAFDKHLSPGQAVPGTLEHFLCERYLLYADGPAGRLFRGHVYHTTYPLREARTLQCQQTLLEAAGIQLPQAEPDHVLFSDGVSVEVFKLAPV